jgi:hypothetical protein
MILDDTKALEIVKQYAGAVSKKISAAREDYIMTAALVNGENFAEVLIEKIEGIESTSKAKARKQYSRDVVDLFERLFSPLNNIFTASGTEKRYDISKFSEAQSKQFLNNISAIKGDISITQYMQDVYKGLMHSDPNGVLFLEYSQENVEKCYVTYKGINAIREYKENGQKLDWILFEKEEVKQPDKSGYYWRLVDDTTDRTFLQVGNSFTLVEDKTFKHPFGRVPASINSFIYDHKKGVRLSPIYKTIPAVKEYARDLSFLSIYKPLKGSPIHWKYVSQCRKCTGTKKVDGKTCPECDGHGYYKGNDVTDLVTIPVPKKDEQKLDPVSGFISTDLETWKQYREELAVEEDSITDTFLGSHVEKKNNETATGRYIDAQPIINTFNQYANWFEYTEWNISELVANFIFTSKPKETQIATIIYGRNYIIDSPDAIYERYQKGKAVGENNVVLDRYLNELITVKYKNDPSALAEELYKASIEPYVHQTLADTFNFFGQREAQKKVYFKTWWEQNSITIIKGSKSDAITKFETDFTIKYPVINLNQNNNGQ